MAQRDKKMKKISPAFCLSKMPVNQRLCRLEKSVKSGSVKKIHIFEKSRS